MSEAKPGAYVEATAATIADGKFREAVDTAVREVFKVLEDYEKETGDLTGKAGAVIDLEVKRMKDSEEFFTFSFSASVKRPKVKRASMVRAGQGRALVSLDPEEEATSGPQMKLPTFDRFGGRRATINKETGEVLGDDAADDGGSEESGDSGVVGRIEQTA